MCERCRKETLKIFLRQALDNIEDQEARAHP
jgi:hypothetical protein